MGLFSLFKKQSKVVIVPSIDQQYAAAKDYVDTFLDEIFDGFEKEESGDFECARFKIAGITNYCTRDDVGLIQGVSFEHNNPYDKTAIALGRIRNGKVSDIFGYIAKDDKKEFKKFSGENLQRPFIGYIREFVSSDGHKGIMGIVKIYKGNGRELYQQMIKDAQLVYGAFRGYYNDTTLEEQGLKLEWLLERKF